MHRSRRVRRWARPVSALTAIVLWSLGLVAVGLTTTTGAAAVPANSQGYWLVASDGGVYGFGTSSFGQLRGHPLNRPVVGMAGAPNGLGYWLVASDGGVFPFGQPFYGSTGNITLNQPIVGMAATPTGHGYWLVAADGGIFNFGDARFYGSTGNIRLNRPVVGMASSHDGGGYWLVASDGGIFNFGDARFYGSTGNIRLNRPVVGMAATPDGGGYWLVASDGGIFGFGDGVYHGSTGGNPGPAPIVGMAATAHGYSFPPGTTGYDVSNYQCGQALPSSHSFAIVQVAGAINGFPNPCYTAEVAWAGSNASSYIFMDALPSPAPPESQSGPAGVCRGNVNCESYNFGYYWARYWVGYSHSLGVDTQNWWLDVELGSWSSDQTSNGLVVAGAVAGLRSAAVLAGIYSTSYQWGVITGSSVSFPGIPLWIPGAGNLSGAGYTAANYCASSAWAPRFAGGVDVLVQWGYSGNFPGAYTGPPHIDFDYACPA